MKLRKTIAASCILLILLLTNTMMAQDMTMEDIPGKIIELEGDDGEFVIMHYIDAIAPYVEFERVEGQVTGLSVEYGQESDEFDLVDAEFSEGQVILTLRSRVYDVSEDVELIISSIDGIMFHLDGILPGFFLDVDYEDEYEHIYEGEEGYEGEGYYGEGYYDEESYEEIAVEDIPDKLIELYEDENGVFIMQYQELQTPYIEFERTDGIITDVTIEYGVETDELDVVSIEIAELQVIISMKSRIFEDPEIEEIIIYKVNDSLYFFDGALYGYYADAGYEEEFEQRYETDEQYYGDEYYGEGEGDGYVIETTVDDIPYKLIELYEYEDWYVIMNYDDVVTPSVEFEWTDGTITGVVVKSELDADEFIVTNIELSEGEVVLTLESIVYEDSREQILYISKHNESMFFLDGILYGYFADANFEEEFEQFYEGDIEYNEEEEYEEDGGGM